MRGATPLTNSGNTICGDNPLGFWGDCNSDIPIEKIVSPYPYKTAEEHYNALLAETKKAVARPHTPGSRCRSGTDFTFAAGWTMPGSMAAR